MIEALALLLALQLPGDTLVLDLETALERGLTVSPTLISATYGAEAAAYRAEQASAWPNVSLAVAAENVGQQEVFTGLSGFEGLEGQAVLRAQIPLGSARSGAIRIARAERSFAEASAEGVALTARADLLGAFGSMLYLQSLLDSSRQELETMSLLAQSLDAQASVGRAADGDAARAELALGMAATRVARREANVARAEAELARILAHDGDQPVRLAAPACPTGFEAADPGNMGRPADGYVAPEILQAAARVEGARGAREAAGAVRLPTLQPEIGIRRSGGNSGLYLGLTTALPLFDRGGRRVDASRSEEGAALTSESSARRAWEAELSGASGALEALDGAGRRFDARWFEAVEETVRSADARFRLGAGTLTELLDSHRARLQAMDDYALWQLEWWSARVDLTRLRGEAPGASLMCTDPYRGVAR